MSSSLVTTVRGTSTEASTNSRIEIPVSGTYWPGWKNDDTVDDLGLKPTQDGEEQKDESPSNRTVTGTAVFMNGEFHPDSRFECDGVTIQPAASSNHYASFEYYTVKSQRFAEHFAENRRGKVLFSPGDESEYNILPVIHFTPRKELNPEQASILNSFRDTDGVKIQGRDDEGHLVVETVVGKQEAE